MLIWWIIFLIAIFSPFLWTYNKAYYYFGLSVAVSADVYGIPIFGKTYVAFDLFALSNLAFILMKAPCRVNSITLGLRTDIFRATFFISISLLFAAIFDSFDGQVNWGLALKPFLVLVEFLVVILYLKLRVVAYTEAMIMDDLVLLVMTVALFNLSVILIQVSGLNFTVPVSSSTYDLYGIHQYGNGERAMGLTREPAHLVVIASSSVLASMATYRYKTALLIVLLWLAIGYLSMTRSISLLVIICLIYSLLVGKGLKGKKSLLIGSVGAVAVVYALVNDRFAGSFHMGTDSSTVLRYSLLLSSISQYFGDPFAFYGLSGPAAYYAGSGLIPFFDNALLRADSTILNSTFIFLFSLPLFFNFILVIVLIVLADKPSRSLIIGFMLSGLIFYQWAYPAVGLYVLYGAFLSQKTGGLRPAPLPGRNDILKLS